MDSIYDSKAFRLFNMEIDPLLALFQNIAVTGGFQTTQAPNCVLLIPQASAFLQWQGFTFFQ